MNTLVTPLVFVRSGGDAFRPIGTAPPAPLRGIELWIQGFDPRFEVGDPRCIDLCSCLSRRMPTSVVSYRSM